MLEHRQQPPLGEILGTRQQRVDRGVGDRSRAAPTWNPVMHGRVFYHAAQSPRRRDGDNVIVTDALISVDEARALVRDATPRLPSEPVLVDGALGRVLAQDVRAASEVPPFACSAMDGYALQPGPAGRRLRVEGESRAGTPSADTVEPGQAMRISTGAAVPRGAGAVIRQEDTRTNGEQIETLTDVVAGENIRAAGEDMHRDDLILAAGAVLNGVELGAAVAAGAAELNVITPAPGQRALHRR